MGWQVLQLQGQGDGPGGSTHGPLARRPQWAQFSRICGQDERIFTDLVLNYESLFHHYILQSRTVSQHSLSAYYSLSHSDLNFLGMSTSVISLYDFMITSIVNQELHLPRTSRGLWSMPKMTHVILVS
jgi:hypothetical protein